MDINTWGKPVWMFPSKQSAKINIIGLSVRCIVKRWKSVRAWGHSDNKTRSSWSTVDERQWYMQVVWGFSLVNTFTYGILIQWKLKTDILWKAQICLTNLKSSVVVFLYALHNRIIISKMLQHLTSSFTHIHEWNTLMDHCYVNYCYVYFKK